MDVEDELQLELLLGELEELHCSEDDRRNKNRKVQEQLMLQQQKKKRRRAELFSKQLSGNKQSLFECEFFPW